MSTPTNTAMVNAWLEHHERERGRSTRTLYTYSKDARRLLMALRAMGNVSLADATPDQLRSWVHAPLVKGTLTGQSPSDSTVKRKVSVCRSLYSFLHAEGLISSNPSARLFAPQVRNENPNPVELHVWRTLWASDLSDAERVAFGLALFCGLRRSEVVSVTPSNFEGKMLTGFERKGGKLGVVPWQSCVQFFAEGDISLFGGSIGSFVNPLSRLIEARPPHSPIVPFEDDPLRSLRVTERAGRVDPQVMNRRLKRALRNAGLAEGEFTPHQLRHTFCTLLVEWGVPLLVVSRLAGHANVTVTERYTRTKEDPLADLLGGNNSGTNNNTAEESITAFSRI